MKSSASAYDTLSPASFGMRFEKKYKALESS